jgi:hypothetical protein
MVVQRKARDEAERAHRKRDKRVKLDDATVQSMVYKAFDTKKYYTFAELQEKTQQPTVGLSAPSTLPLAPARPSPPGVFRC